MATAVSAALIPMANSVKKNPSSCSGEEEPVEDDEVDIDRIEDQLDGNQHRQQVAARDKSVNSHEHHDRGEDEIIFHVYHSRTFLAFACDEDSADYAGQQQDADDLERQHVAVFAAAHQRMADGLHVQFAVNEMRRPEIVSERHIKADARDSAASRPSPTKSLYPRRSSDLSP